MSFMGAKPARVGGLETFVTRSGYTGEDGYEISVAGSEAEAFARLLLAQADVAPIGLGARDSLRLEAGLCLYGHELDETVDPVEAALVWSIQKRRRVEGGFPGAARIQASAGARAGATPGRPAAGRPRPGARGRRDRVARRRSPSASSPPAASGPSVGGPIAMGFVEAAHAKAGNAGRSRRARQASPGSVSPRLPFHPHAYHPWLKHKEAPCRKSATPRTTNMSRLEGDVAVVGISDHAQQQLGDIVFVEVPAIGEKLTRATPAAVVESVKAASDVFVAVSGEVIAVNVRGGVARA